MTWDEIALRHGTDKASSYHGYMAHYERVMGHRVGSVRRVLEIGVLHGWSLRVWADVFPDAQITGVDVDPETAFYDERITVAIADATDPRHMAAVVAAGPFDFVVDDGSHNAEDIAATFAILRPHLSPGAVYAVEDTRMGPPHPSRDPAPLGDVVAVLAADMGIVRIDIERSQQQWGEYHWQALVLAETE